MSSPPFPLVGTYPPLSLSIFGVAILAIRISDAPVKARGRPSCLEWAPPPAFSLAEGTIFSPSLRVPSERPSLPKADVAKTLLCLLRPSSISSAANGMLRLRPGVDD